MLGAPESFISFVQNAVTRLMHLQKTGSKLARSQLVSRVHVGGSAGAHVGLSLCGLRGSLPQPLSSSESKVGPSSGVHQSGWCPQAWVAPSSAQRPGAPFLLCLLPVSFSCPQDKPPICGAPLSSAPLLCFQASPGILRRLQPPAFWPHPACRGSTPLNAAPHNRHRCGSTRRHQKGIWESQVDRLGRPHWGSGGCGCGELAGNHLRGGWSQLCSRLALHLGWPHT